MCGPSSQEKTITNEQQDFYQNLSKQYNTVFGENQQIVGALTNAFTPILQAGPSQEGWSPSQAAAMNTAATEKTATDYAQAQKATAQQLAARGGGDTFLPSSVNANILAANTNAAAAERAGLQNQNTLANYQQGNQNWQTAAGVLTNAGQLTNPTPFASATSTAGNDAMTSANAMAQQAFQPWGAAFSALGSIGGAALGRFMMPSKGPSPVSA
jgi:hypothetical protein